MRFLRISKCLMKRGFFVDGYFEKFSCFTAMILGREMLPGWLLFRGFVDKTQFNQ